MTYTFIVSDESVNVYDTIVKTKGIDTQEFLRNPVMYFNHNRDKGVIGRWENLRIDGTTLLADAVFDTKNELGATVARQVEEGFLRSASVGLEAIETEFIDGVQVITRCKLREISVVDIPANTNAVKLSMPKNKIITLNAPIYKDLRGELIRILGLNNSVSDISIIEHIKGLLKDLEHLAEIPELIDTDEDIKQQYRLLYRTNRKLYNALIETERNKTNSLRNTLIDNALKEGRISYAVRDQWLKLAQGMKTDALAFILSAMPKALKITQFINGQMTLEEYVKYNPKALADDPALLKDLLKEAVANQTNKNNTRDLNWYRKNDPKFLQDNPEIYKRLIDEELKKKEH